ncbi:MAG: DUF3108 domain-containing protein [Candidatus Omnitrophota bacterium]|nr:DUF3108 domain-containing protein [Candidatus Omnitrophota bacterium]
MIKVMFKIASIGFALVFIATALSFAEQPQEGAVAAPPARIPKYERVTYNVRWLKAPVGKIVVSINGIKNIHGRDAYEVEIAAKTNDFCSKIYKIDDRYVSYVDMEGLYTLRHEVYRREGRYKKDAVTVFDQTNHKAYFKNFLDKSEKVFDIPPKVQDPVSAYYYFRTLPMSVGKGIDCWVSNNESNYHLFGVVEKKEIISIPNIGQREAFFIQPYAKLGGRLVRKGKASGYFSRDEKRTPLVGVIKAPLFTAIIAELEKAEYL